MGARTIAATSLMVSSSSSAGGGSWGTLRWVIVAPSWCDGYLAKCRSAPRRDISRDCVLGCRRAWLILFGTSLSVRLVGTRAGPPESLRKRDLGLAVDPDVSGAGLAGTPSSTWVSDGCSGRAARTPNGRARRCSPRHSQGWSRSDTQGVAVSYTHLRAHETDSYLV